MSNSNLVVYTDTTTQNRDVRTSPITIITIHHAAGVLDLSGFSSILHSGREVSWNYAVANNGQIGLYVPEAYRAWTSSSRSNDMKAITIEVSNSTNSEPWPISPAAYASLLNLCDDICRRNNIQKIIYTGSTSGNLTMHKWFTSTGCPGPTLSSKFPDIAQQVNTRLGQPSNLQYITNPNTMSPTAASVATLGTYTPIELLLDYTQITPYIATLDKLSVDLDATKLKAAGVIGLMIEGGSLYDVTHMEISNYRNPKLETQVAFAIKHNIPYALYFTTKARNIAEANKELSLLQPCVRKYSPTLGVWIQPVLGSIISVNNSIIDRYYDILVQLGFKQKVGLYTTKDQLRRIDWSARCNTWYLWLNEHVSTEAELQKILTPEFFMTKKRL